MAEAKYQMTVYPVQVAVRSASDGAAVHQVSLAYCDCADFTNRKGRLDVIAGVPVITICKHIAQAMQLVGGWHREPEIFERLSQKEVLDLLTGERVNLTQTLARRYISDVGSQRTSKAEFNSTRAAGFVTYEPLRSKYTVTLI